MPEPTLEQMIGQLNAHPEIVGYKALVAEKTTELTSLVSRFQGALDNPRLNSDEALFENHPGKTPAYKSRALILPWGDKFLHITSMYIGLSKSDNPRIWEESAIGEFENLIGFVRRFGGHGEIEAITVVELNKFKEEFKPKFWSDYKLYGDTFPISPSCYDDLNRKHGLTLVNLFTTAGRVKPVEVDKLVEGVAPILTVLDSVLPTS